MGTVDVVVPVRIVFVMAVQNPNEHIGSLQRVIAKRWSAYYGYPHCTIIAMHNVEPAVFAVLIDPVLNLFHLDKVNLNPKAIEKKIGVFGEPMVIGLFIGMLIGIIGSIGYLDSLKTWGQIFYVAVSAGFAIPAGAALITSFNILGKPMLGLVFLAIPCSARPSSRRTRRTSSTPSIPQSSRRRQMRSCASSRPSRSQRSSRRCSPGCTASTPLRTWDSMTASITRWRSSPRMCASV